MARVIRHIFDLPISRLRKLIGDESIADKLADWFINLKGRCPSCGEEKYPFAGITKEEFMVHVSTRDGAEDFARAVKDFFSDKGQRTHDD